MSDSNVEEIYRHEENQVALEISKGEVSSVRNKNVTRQAARLFLRNQVQSASFCGQIADNELLNRAKSAVDTSVPCAYSPASQGSVRRSLTREKKVDVDSLIQITTQTLEYLKRKAPQFIYSGKVVNQDFQTTLGNSLGLNCAVNYTSTGWSILYKHKKSASIMDGYFASESLSECSFKEAVDANLPFLNSFENEVDWPTEMSLPVVFSEGAPSLNKIGESLRIDRYSEGTALYSGQLGKKIFGSSVHIEDVSFDPERAVVMPFDGEGTVRSTETLSLVESGVMTHFISDLRNGAKYGTASTGNARRLGETRIALDFNALTMKRGTESYQNILNSIPRCIFVILGGGGSTSDSGEFSSPVQLAFLMENGKVVGRLTQLTVRSSIQKMFGERFFAVSQNSFTSGGLHPCFFAEMRVFKN